MDIKKLIQDATDAAIKATNESLAKMPTDCCGFAWVTIRPATGPLIKEMKAQGIGRKAYGGGWQIWNPSGHPTQNITAKEDGAWAYAKVLSDAGFNVSAHARMD